MNVKFIQSADPIFYYQMLHETSRTVRTYCRENGFEYESYVGIKRGVVPWNAAYNRVYMLKDLVDRGYVGWVFYMDADAYIYDMQFDLRKYLSDKHHYAGIMAGYIDGVISHSINSGGFAVNLGHVVGRQLALDYWSAVEAIPDQEYNRAIVWGMDIPEDQLILFRILERYCETLLTGDAFLFERVNEGFTNHGPFVRQALRSKSADFRSRMELIRSEVGVAMAGHAEADGDQQPGYYLAATHPALRVANGRRSLGAIHSTFRDGVVTFGPYMTLASGRYIVRIFGEARPALDGRPSRMAADLTSGDGQMVWARNESSISPGKGILIEFEVNLADPVDRVEVRTFVDQFQDISITAVQIQWTDRWVRET